MVNGQMTQQELAMRPTSSYLCSHCKTQLFTNLDILIHEQLNKEDRVKGSKSRERKRRMSKNNTTVQKELDPEVATIMDFKSS
jgi:hypothetical protein